MSLGVRSLWRAQARAAAAPGGLSLIPRDLGFNPANRIWPPDRVRRASTESAGVTETGAARTTTTPTTAETETANETRAQGAAFRRLLSPAENQSQTKPTPSNSSLRRAALRRAIKEPSSPGANDALIRPAGWYPDKHEVARAQRKSHRSRDCQVLWSRMRDAEDKPLLNWRGVLTFLSRLTPQFGTIYDFKVTVGRGAADEVRSWFPESILDRGQLQQRTRAIVRLDDTADGGAQRADGSLRLILTGSEHSVREALLDLLTTSGEITAVRVTDNDSEGILHDMWLEKNSQLESVRLLKKGERGPDERILTLHREQASAKAQPRRKPYILLRRADEIPRPSVWTRSSLEHYVSQLVLGEVPPHLVHTLYKNGPDHQHTVVSLLMEIFESKELRKALSINTLALALGYVQGKKISFRPAAREIFNQAEIGNIPIDTRIFNLFIKGSVLSGDLAGFDSVLKIMARKRYFADSETWLLFLKLVEDVEAKRIVLRRMRKKGLNRIESTLIKAGRHMAPYELEGRLQNMKSIADFLDHQTQMYGPKWLDVITVNRMLDILGRNSRLDLCNELLDILFETGASGADVISLNTLISHTRSTQGHIATIRLLQARWPWIEPDQLTYQLLFRIAWRNRLPNMLRVIWHYASFAGLTSSKMRAQLSGQARREEGLSGRQSLLKSFHDTIMGLSALHDSNGPEHAVRVSKHHAATALIQQPLLPFSDMLGKAYELDRTIHQRIRDGVMMTPAVRDSLTVEIRLKPRTQAKVPLLTAPEGSAG